MKLFKTMLKGNTLYYPGCLTKFVLKDIQQNYKIILEKEGIDYIMLKDKELCCGSPLKNAGVQKEYEEFARKNHKVFKDHGVSRIISNCPACVKVLRTEYKEILGKEWDIEVKHMTEIIHDSLPQHHPHKKKQATYHDPCHLGRGLGIYDKPRHLIERSGFEIKEMALSKEKSFCCGGGGGVKSNNPELANRIGADRTDQAKDTGAEVLFTPCPMCYANLKENSTEIEVMELSQLLDDPGTPGVKTGKKYT